MKSPESKRVALYVRCSTEHQSTDLQERELSEYAAKRGWVVHKIYRDMASGTTPNRRMLQELMSDCRQRKVDILCVWKLDRLFRSLKNMVTVLADLSELGIDFCCLKDPVDLTTPQGVLLAQLISAFAEFEVSLIRSRVVAGLQAARARGVKLGRRPVINQEVEAEIHELRSRGLSIREIERRMGRRISRSSIERVLKCRKAGA